MKRTIVAALLWSVFVSGKGAPEPAAPFSGQYLPMTGQFLVYGGALSDPLAPMPSDSKIAFVIEGNAAKEIFNAIGPDLKDACSSGGEKGLRSRQRDAEKLSCMFYPKEGYRCFFGFDFKNGKSIGGQLLLRRQGRPTARSGQRCFPGRSVKLAILLANRSSQCHDLHRPSFSLRLAPPSCCRPAPVRRLRHPRPRWRLTATPSP